MAGFETDRQVLDALRHLHARDGRATIRALADETGHWTSTVQASLKRLRHLGLVANERGAGMLRPADAKSPHRHHAGEGMDAVWAECRRLDELVNGAGR